MRYPLLLLHIYCLVSAFADDAQKDALFANVDLLASTVVMLKTEFIQTRSVDGQMCEVWIKKPQEKQPIPLVGAKTASAFLITKAKRMFLVTAAHVARETTPQTQVLFGDKQNLLIRAALAEFSGKPLTLDWAYHDKADVALLELSPGTYFITKYFKKRFLDSTVIEPSTEAPKRDVQLTMLGFPLGLGAMKEFSPISRVTRPASGMLELKADTNTPCQFFLSENPSIEGFSGAPCFDIGLYSMGAISTRSGPTRCVGIIHGTIRDDSGAQLALITPAFYLAELIDSKTK